MQVALTCKLHAPFGRQSVAPIVVAVCARVQAPSSMISRLSSTGGGVAVCERRARETIQIVFRLPVCRFAPHVRAQVSPSGHLFWFICVCEFAIAFAFLFGHSARDRSLARKQLNVFFSASTRTLPFGWTRARARALRLFRAPQTIPDSRSQPFGDSFRRPRPTAPKAHSTARPTAARFRSGCGAKELRARLRVRVRERKGAK